MARKTTFVMLAVLAMLLLQLTDCMSAMTQDEQSMQCCGSMPCDPSNQSHDCCKTMVSSQSPSVLPAEHSVLNVPVVVATDHLSVPEVPVFTQISCLSFEAPQHSPPELYTLYSSLLI